MIPREVLPSPSHWSAHYPGIDVHVDMHSALPCTRLKAHAKEEVARVVPKGG
jgi:hypothetical protein